MSETLYKLVFEGKTQPGFKEKVVKKNLKALLNADRAKMKRLFSGEPVVIRKNLSQTKVREFEKELIDAGAAYRILSVKEDQELPAFNPIPDDGLSDDQSSGGAQKKRTKFRGNSRIGRTQFLALLWFNVALGLLGWFVPDYLPQLLAQFPELASLVKLEDSQLIACGFYGLAVLSFIYTVSLRLHDMERSGWLWILLLIPVLNVLFMISLSLSGGTSGWNRFGPIPNKPSIIVSLLGLWIPMLGILAMSGAAWLHQDEVLQIDYNVPQEATGVMDWLTEEATGAIDYWSEEYNEHF